MEVDNRIQVLEDNTDLLSLVNNIVKNGQQEEGFYLCDVSEIVRKYNNWKKFFPRIPIFYAVKCNDTRIVLETQAALGVGFSCVSQEEIRKVISLGVSPERIIFANPTKKISHLIYAAEIGVELITFDNEEELFKIKKYHPSAQLILRIDTDETSKRNILNRKYGVQSDEEINHVLTVAKSLDLNVMGVSVYVECSHKNIEDYSRAIAMAKKVFNTAFKLEYNFKLLDIGGVYQGKKKDSLFKVSKVIKEALDINFPNNKVEVIAEVERYCVESAFKTITYIHSKRILNDGTRMYFLDIGAYNGLLPAILNDYYVCNPLKDHLKSPVHPSILWGPTCDSTDKITKDIDYLPEMEVGDWVIFDDTGAYTLPVTYEFNGYNLPSIHAIVKIKDWLTLTGEVSQPLSKSLFVTGESVGNCLTGLNNPYIYKPQYY